MRYYCTNFLGRHVTRKDRLGPCMVRFFGIGLRRSLALCRKVGIPYNRLIAPLPLRRVRHLERLISRRFPKEFVLRRRVNNRLYAKYANSSNAGLRLSQGLPMRRQRTKTNAQTARRLRIDVHKLSRSR
jgi:ribosomal protein S13